MPFLAAVLVVIVWLVVMAVGFAVVFPVVFSVTLAATALWVVGFYYAHACRALAGVRADGPAPVAVPPTSPPIGSREAGGEPAYRHYLLGQVWRDWWSIARTTVPRVRGAARRALTATTRTLLGSVWGFFTFPLWLAICGGIVLAAVPVAVLGAALALLYAVVAAVGLAGWLAGALVLAAVERVFMAYGRILQTCPHPFCYAKIALPMYECPSCGARHRRLAPNRWGAFRHVCRCGARLPTTIPLGRYRLTAYCPHCAGRLPERIGRVRVEPLPFIGGPAAGKTTFMFLAIRAVSRRAHAAGGRVAFVEPRHAQAYAGALGEFRRGGQLAKTGPELPLATMVDVDLPGPGRRILYVFDPAGEHFTGATQVESLRYLDHGEALLFVIDPFALPEVRRAMDADESERVAKAAATSDEDPSDTLQRVLNELRSRPDQGRQKRIAVVVTKADLVRGTAIGGALCAEAAPDVRAWLGGLGMGNTIRTLDQAAGQVRYFASGLDTDPAAVAELVGWVTGLPLNGHTPRHAVEPNVPAAALRDEWSARGRPAELVPAGYQAGRWAILAGLSTLNIGALGLCLWWVLRLLP
ncbi:MAG TPA: hypothetical protein VF069_05365 [Streptosporangiaceae bacterium]